MKGLLNRIEWGLVQLLDRVVTAVDRRLAPEPRKDPNVVTFVAQNPFWEEHGNTRRLDFGGFGLVFERKED